MKEKRDVDKTIVLQVQQGDKQAFNLLVVKYQFRVAKLVSRYIHDSHEILDVSQEVFIKAYRALAHFRGESAFYTWLYRIAINTAKNYVVAQIRRPPNIDIDMQEAELFDGQLSLKENASPEHELLSDEIEHTVFNAVEHLAQELRTAIILREIEGLTYEEIAHVMDCPVGTVRSRIFRAREAIDKKLRPLLTED